MERITSSDFFLYTKDFFASIGLSADSLTHGWTIFQLGYFITAIVISRLARARLEEPINERLKVLEGQWPLLRVLIILHRRLFWLILSLILWIGYLALQTVTWPSNSYLIWILAALSTAWFVISFLSRLIRNRFISRSVAILAWLTAALYILGLFPKTISALDAAGFELGDSRISALTAIQTAVLLATLLWAASLTSQFVANAISKNDDLTPSIKVLLTKFTRIALLGLAVLVSLGAVGIDFTVLAVFSGALGIGIGLGLQKIVSNFTSGIILLLDESIKPGDVIEIETVSGTTYGWVQHLGARCTVVRTRDGTETLIPNDAFIESAVTNWTHSNKIVRRKLPIGVSYDTDVEKAVELCLEAVTDVPRVLQVPKPVCLVKGFGDSSVDLELRFWINDPEGGIANVSSNVYLEVWKRFKKERIEIPFPQRDLNIRSSIPLEIKK